MKPPVTPETKETINIVDAILAKLQYNHAHQFTDPDGGIDRATATQQILELLTQRELQSRNKLFNLIESEVIGEDDKDVRGTTQNPDNPIYHTRRTKHNNELRATQRTQLQLIKERIK